MPNIDENSALTTDTKLVQKSQSARSSEASLPAMKQMGSWKDERTEEPSRMASPRRREENSLRTNAIQDTTKVLEQMKEKDPLVDTILFIFQSFGVPSHRF
eukprot:5070915-Amphidinium_carterae.1